MGNLSKLKISQTMNILGHFLLTDLKMDSQIGTLCASLHNKLFNLKKVEKYTNFKTRLKILNPHIMGKLQYLLPLYQGSNQDQLSKIHKVMMSAARMAIGPSSFKQSNIAILKQCKWLPLTKLIDMSVLNFIHKVMTSKTPDVLYNLYKVPKRSIVDITPKYIPKTAKTEKYFLYIGMKKYNKLPILIKKLQLFKKINKRSHQWWRL